MSDYSTMPTDPTAMMQALGPMFAVFAVIFLLVLGFCIFIQWKIFSKAGHPGWLSLLNLLLLVPVVNFIAPFVMLGVWIWFAFSDWPALKKAQGGA